MSDLASFSEWAIALLPRLFLYPGGLWLLGLVFTLRMLTHGSPEVTPGKWLKDLSRAGIAQTALAWTAVALLPLQAMTTLTFPTDRLALTGMVAISLLLEGHQNQRSAKGYAPIENVELAILVAVAAPLAAQTSLLAQSEGPSAWIALLATALGVTLLAPGARGDLSMQVRMVAWLGIAGSPLWALDTLAGPWHAAIAYAVLVAGAAIVGRLAHGRVRAAWSTGAVWALAGLSLLAALFAHL